MSELAMIARCMICHAPFAGPKFVKIGMGLDVKNNRLAVFTEKLTRHIFEKHPEAAREILTEGAEFQGALFLSHFQTEDENLKEQMDFLRWKIHQKTLAARYSDAMIEQWVGQIVPQMLTLAEMRDVTTLTTNLTGMLQSMRDGLEEPGKYKSVPFDTGITAGKAS